MTAVFNPLGHCLQAVSKVNDLPPTRVPLHLVKPRVGPHLDARTKSVKNLKEFQRRFTSMVNGIGRLEYEDNLTLLWLRSEAKRYKRRAVRKKWNNWMGYHLGTDHSSLVTETRPCEVKDWGSTWPSESYSLLPGISPSGRAPCENFEYYRCHNVREKRLSCGHMLLDCLWSMEEGLVVIPQNVFS